MKLRTHVNLIVASLSAAFVILAAWLQFDGARRAVREEIAGANVVATQLLTRILITYDQPDNDTLLTFLQHLGRVRAHEITVRAMDGRVIYKSPPSPYKAGRDAPAWYSALILPPTPVHIFTLANGSEVRIEADASRAVLDGWDDFTHLMIIGGIAFAVLNAAVFWLVGRAVAPWPIIVDGLARIEQGDLQHRLPKLEGYEASMIGSTFNRMAQSLQEKLLSDRKAIEAEQRLQQRRELDRLIEQRLDEERRLIARELHDEFAQSVTAIRSFAVVIANQHPAESRTTDVARLISTEAAQLYDAMHGLIPRLAPVTLDTLGLAETLEGFIKQWQSRHPTIHFSLHHELPAELGDSITIAVYRVVQEAVINAVRHARPTRVEVSVVHSDSHIRIHVTDNGSGLPEDWSRPGHFGLRGLQERMAMLGGTLTLKNREPHGVELAAEIPLGAHA
ncbi:ATP-binding protein [Steroidobacter cummioxidans]|uniref:ATP-binding protein n=1 Tax=Steroidobacter cummioxidans TaxID=1803913 RepID=UPI000E323C1C|nr:ATP-binding protein [Steroidobacter cummioxidans]